MEYPIKDTDSANVSRFFAGIVNETALDNGATRPFTGRFLGRYVVGDGRWGLKLKAAEFFNVLHVPSALAPIVNYWFAAGFDGFGTWIHDGTVYVDPHTRTEDLAHALDLARERGELAIWDSEQGEAINV